MVVSAQMVLSVDTLSAVLGELVDAVLVLDEHGTVVYANRASIDALGVDATGMRLSDLENTLDVRDPSGGPLPAEDKPSEILALGRQVEDVHLSFAAPRAERRAWGISMSPILVDESPFGWTLVLRDVTDREQLGRQLRESEQRMRLANSLGETLNDINRAIDSALDFDSIMSTVVRQSAKALGADVAGVVRREDDHWVGRYLYGIPFLSSVPISERDYHHLEAVAVSRRPEVVADLLTDPRVEASVAARYGIRSLVAARLEVRGELIGILGFGYSSGPLRFEDEKCDFVEKLAAIVSLGLENTRLLEAEQHVSQTLQSAMLALNKEVHGIAFGTLYRSASETARVGGDFYDVYDLPRGKVAIVIGDISGKGLEAAAMTSLVKNTVRAYAEEGHDPAVALEMANTVVVGASEAESFATLFFGILDTSTGSLVYCSAGHPPALLKRSDGGLEWLAEQSPLVGAVEEGLFVDGRTNLGTGDVLVMYTDGATEARCSDGHLGEARLAAFVDDLPQTRAEAMPKEVFDFVMSCTGGILRDDLALLAVELKR